jgi:hypothetical protein
MLAMKPGVTRHYVQTTKSLKKLYNFWAERIKTTKACAGRDGPTNDAIGNALFLWARDQDVEEMSRNLLPYIERFEQQWAGVLDAKRDEGNPGVSPGGVPSPPSGVRDLTKPGSPSVPLQGGREPRKKRPG